MDVSIRIDLPGEDAHTVGRITTRWFEDCVPKLRFCVDSIQAFDDRLRAQDFERNRVNVKSFDEFDALEPRFAFLQQDDAIQRVDEVLLDKAQPLRCTLVAMRSNCASEVGGVFLRRYDNRRANTTLSSSTRRSSSVCRRTDASTTRLCLNPSLRGCVSRLQVLDARRMA